MNALKMWIRGLDYTKKSLHLTLPGLIDQLAETHGGRPALIGESDSMSYRCLAARVTHHAQWAIDKGIAGQTIALLMYNCPDYVAIWLGLTRVGCTVALLNTNLRANALNHCINISGAQYLIVSPGLLPFVDAATPVEIINWPLRHQIGDGIPPLDFPLPTPQDTALLIYTSGTTGLPKAAKVSHQRVTEWSFWFAGMEDAKPDDRLYNCLPMYHSVGGIVAVGSMLVSGGSVVTRQKFSASNFWSDVVQFDCTIFQYIGELCRYLTLLSPSEIERKHRLRLAVGNGMQECVWRTLQERFAIPHILEYYAATEGVVSLYNCEGKPGAIGRIPPFLEPHFGIKLVRINEAGDVVRNEEGFCIVSETNEPGEAIGLIRDDRRFDGYHDTEASNRKVLKDVLAQGDRWYRTGDLMRKDAAGFYYFLDRLGDTYRWKGENVSTTEVANVVRECPGVLDAIIYGIAVPGTEGRAGMAAITTTKDFSFETLADYLKLNLPSYARPIYIRLCKSLDTTGTFKLTKSRFLAEGFEGTQDPVWTYSPCADKFVPICSVTSLAG